MPKVSVVLPVYNTSACLREALDSVTRQAFRDIEIICVNDGSTDNSLDIIKEYTDMDDRNTVINKPNGGYGHTMNVGMDAATGEYLGILETDAFLDLTMYEDLYALADSHHLDTIRGSFTGLRVKKTAIYIYNSLLLTGIRCCLYRKVRGTPLLCMDYVI